ncbi:MAG: hypothetical protein RLZZ271_1129 [Pseudomonadota bacterium]
MKSITERCLAVLLLWCITTCLAQAHDSLATASRFDQHTWAQLLKSGPRPAAYLFTTTYCSTCPDAFEQLNKAIERKHVAKRTTDLKGGSAKPHVAVVIMDSHNSKTMGHAHHFATASRLYFFDGSEAAIRYAIDPQWRNITPYIVLVDATGKIQRSTGSPEAAALNAWLPS